MYASLSPSPLFLFLFLSLSLSLSPSFHLSHLLCLGDEENVVEEEEVPLLCLQAGLELSVGMSDEVARGRQVGLDQHARLRTHWHQEVLPRT